MNHEMMTLIAMFLRELEERMENDGCNEWTQPSGMSKVGIARLLGISTDAVLDNNRVVGALADLVEIDIKARASMCQEDCQ